MKSTNGLFVGQMGRGQTCQMRCDALGRLGFKMQSIDSTSMWTTMSWAERHVQQRLPRSSTVERFNELVLRAVRAQRPAFFWAEKQEYLTVEVLREIKALGVLTVHYNPDPYFSLAWKRTPHMDECLAAFDVLVVTKRYELGQYAAANPGLVLYSPLGFDILGHRRIDSVPSGYRSDLAFVGGWEPRRERLVLGARSPGRSIKVWGYGWRLAQQSRFNPLRALRLGRLTTSQRPYFGPSRPELEAICQNGEGRHGEVYEERYSAAVAGAKISLGFLREICLDEHTTRSFEIPAMGGFLLGDRSEEHLEFFEEGTEAEYFASDEEFYEKVEYYIAHDDRRNQIAAAGFQRCMSSGYSYDDRLRRVVSQIGLLSASAA